MSDVYEPIDTSRFRDAAAQLRKRTALPADLAPPLAVLLDEMADHADTDPADGTCNRAAAQVADRILAAAPTGPPTRYMARCLACPAPEQTFDSNPDRADYVKEHGRGHGATAAWHLYNVRVSHP